MKTSSRALNISEGLYGVLARNVPTRLVEVSRSGCLLETRERVEGGTVGELEIHVGSEIFVDDVRVTRCVLVEGSGSNYLVGAEFVQTRYPRERSIRRAVMEVLRELARRPTISEPVRSNRNGRSEAS